MLTDEIKISALKLDTIDGAHSAETLLESLDKTDKEIEQIWVKESEKRYRAYKDGHIKGIPLEQIRSRFEK